MAFTSISMLDVVILTAPDTSATVVPFTLTVNAQPDLTSLLTDPFLNMCVVFSTVISDDLFNDLVGFTIFPLSALTS